MVVLWRQEAAREGTSNVSSDQVVTKLSLSSHQVAVKLSSSIPRILYAPLAEEDVLR